MLVNKLVIMLQDLHLLLWSMHLLLIPRPLPVIHLRVPQLLLVVDGIGFPLVFKPEAILHAIEMWRDVLVDFLLVGGKLEGVFWDWLRDVGS